MSVATERRRAPRRRASLDRRLYRRLRRALREAWAAEPAVGPPLDRRTRARLLARQHLLPLALYLLVTALVTYPLALHFGTHLPGDDRDAWQNYWDFWWLRRALSAGQNPFWTPLLYAPDGVPLYLHTLNLFNGLVTLPVQVAFGVTVAYNTVIFLSFTLAAYCAYLLVAYVSGSWLAGFAGGVIYAFGSYHMAHLLGHTNLLASEWLPAYVLCLLAANAARGRRRTLWIGGGVLALALVMLCDWQYVLFAVLFTVLYALYAAAARRSVAPLAIAGAIGAAWAIVASPLLVPTIVELRQTAGTRPAVLGPRGYSADLLSFVLPSPLQTWWGGRAEGVLGRAAAPAVERAVFLGYLPLALAACGVWWCRRRAIAWFWVLCAAGFGALALGPTLAIGGRWRFGEAGWSVPLPYRLLQALPLVNVSRVPARFALVVTLCLAVLAGLGLAALGRRLAPLRRPRTRLALLPLLVAALLVEHLAVPYPLAPVREPVFYRYLAQSAEAGTVLELPFAIDRSRSLFHQTIHGRPIVGGYLSRPLAYPLAGLPPFRELPDRARRPEIIGGEAPSDLGAWVLAHADVRWIVVLLDEARFSQQEVITFLARYAEPAPFYQDGRMAVFRPLPPGSPASYLELGEGWHALETVADGRARLRWFASLATFTAWSFGPEPRTYTLSFDAATYHQPRRLEVKVEGRVIGQWLVQDFQHFAIPLTLDNGPHRIELRALDPPISPARAGGAPDDTRPLAFGIANVELRR